MPLLMKKMTISFFIRTYGSCSNTAGSFSCKCSVGYTGTPPNCGDLDECSAGSFIFFQIKEINSRIIDDTKFRRIKTMEC